MSDEIEALAQRMADADPKVQIDFLLRVASEVTVERDNLRRVVDGYQDDLSHIAFAVAGDRTGAVNHDDILGLVKGVVAERDSYARTIDEHKEVADGVAAFWKEQADERGAERDRLRVIVERAHDHIGLDEHVLRTLAVDDLVALVSVLRLDAVELREGHAKATAAADAAAEAVGNMAEYTGQAVVERDRLRAVVADITEHATPIAEDDDGFVAVGYTVTVGAIHRALAAQQQVGQLDVSPTGEGT